MVASVNRDGVNDPKRSSGCILKIQFPMVAEKGAATTHFQLELGELAHLKLVVLGQRGRSPNKSTRTKGEVRLPFWGGELLAGVKSVLIETTPMS